MSQNSLLSLKFDDIKNSNVLNNIIYHRDSNFINMNAYHFISNEIKNNDFIFINEAHYNPQHQIFISNLLNSLPKDSVIFCAEMFPTDKGKLLEINNDLSGQDLLDYYDPTYYEIIRTALNEKIKVYGFDNYKETLPGTDTIQDNDSVFYVINKNFGGFYKEEFNSKTNEWDISFKENIVPDELSREYKSYCNLKSLKEMYPNRCILVFSAGIHGYHNENKKTYGYYIHEDYKSISINQTTFYTENTDSPLIIMSNSQDFDYEIVHNVYSFDRKSNSFIFNFDMNRKKEEVNYLKFKEYIPFLVFVYSKSSYHMFKENAIPIDIYEVNEKSDLKNTIYPLKLEDYKINIVKSNGKNIQLEKQD